MYLFHSFIVLFLLLEEISGLKDVIYAINAGGDAYSDTNGIRYERDPLFGKVGTASDYGKQLLIGRVNQNDQILYQTERYHHSTFGYDIPVKEDGDYVLILKFCEVYFNAPNMKVCTYDFVCYSRPVCTRSTLSNSLTCHITLVSTWC